MTVYELIEKMDGYILNNKARVMHNGESVVVGVFEGETLVFTAIGDEIAAIQSNQPTKAAKKAKPVQEEQPAVESEQAAPEAAPQE